MKIVAEFDTNTKKLTVKKDGQTVPNINQVSLGSSYRDDEFYCELSTAVRDEANDCWLMTRTVASDSLDGKAARLANQGRDSSLDGFIDIQAKSRVEEDTLNCFK